MSELEKKDRSAKRAKEVRRYVAVNLNCEMVGIWGNLKKCCQEMKERDAGFPSYWTIVRKTDENPIKFTTETGEYAVYIEKLK
jgi:hypothetical protein